MNQALVGQALGRVTKMFLAPMGPLQYFLDSPGVTHVHCLEQAYQVLRNDHKQNVETFFRPYHQWLRKGLFWADRGWKNVCHYYTKPDKQGAIYWPGAAAECQFYFNKALAYIEKDLYKSMFYIGATLHLVQDMCVPHHSIGAIFDGHREFEKWATEHWRDFPANACGLYLPFTHPSQWIDYTARLSADYYPKVSLEAGCNELSYQQAARELLPLTVYVTAGFLNFTQDQFKGKTLRLK